MISVSTKYIREGVWKCNLCNRISFQINRVFHIWYIRRTSCKVGFISIAKWWVAGFSLWSFCWYFILRGLFENRWPTHVWQILFKISCRYSIYENNNTFLQDIIFSVVYFCEWLPLSWYGQLLLKLGQCFLKTCVTFSCDVLEVEGGMLLP